MPGLEDDYAKFERKSRLLQQLEGVEESAQLYRISMGLVGQIRKRSFHENLAPEQYLLRLSQGRRFLDDLRLALSSHQGEDVSPKPCPRTPDYSGRKLTHLYAQKLTHLG